ncbi:enoyl-CoA hydratase/isomerase family protein [Tardiphaga sp. 367_B4_N1_1]|uniref:enoyl-CoA hydratase/isomerase family protein n=1 Tax=Tardiphaga sp. 367_B4_N1_1 TaxID=3240777 RepID=UPI003F239DB8
MTQHIVRYEVIDKVAHITLDRPPVNALSLDLIRAVVAAFKRAADDDAARVVILSSAIARRFSAGLDLDILLGKPGEEIRKFLQELYINLYDAQYNLGKPSIAAVNGAARGGGMTMAVSCDVVLAAESATFGYPEIDVGVLPAIHFAHLPRIIGRHRAFELLFTGRVIDAREACDLGIVTRVVPDAELDAAAATMATTFAAKSETVVRMGRAAFMRQIDLDYRRSIANAVEDFVNVAVTDAAQEGLRAFVEKRAPKWND